MLNTLSLKNFERKVNDLNYMIEKQDLAQEQTVLLQQHDQTEITNLNED